LHQTTYHLGAEINKNGSQDSYCGKKKLLKQVHGFTSNAAFGWYHSEQVNFYLYERVM
jgi:hypothetical protein